MAKKNQVDFMGAAVRKAAKNLAKVVAESIDAHVKLQTLKQNMDRAEEADLQKIKDAIPMPNHKLIQRPPLGLMPRWLHREQRLEEIMAALDRYIKEKKLIPREWMQEFNQLMEEVNEDVRKETPENKEG